MQALHQMKKKTTRWTELKEELQQNPQIMTIPWTTNFTNFFVGEDEEEEKKKKKN